MATQDPDDDFVLSEAQFREVIERATRADLTQDGISVAVLRQVAQELDVDPRALQRALGDVVGVSDARQPVRGWFRRQITNAGRIVDFVLPKRGRLVAGIAVGTFLGWLTAHVAVGLRVVIGETSRSIGSSSFIDVPVFLLLVALTFGNSLSRRLDRRLDRYLAEIATMWGAFAISWSITFGGSTSDLAVTTLASIVVAAVWGWIVIGRRAGPGSAESVAVTAHPHALPVIPEEKGVNPLERSSQPGFLALIMLGISLPQARRASLTMSGSAP
jgi:hypothetical protein